jgi:ABC-type multidrug transport system fused ATPase/permease subunit
VRILARIWQLLNARQRRRLAFLQLVSIAMAFSTVGGIAAVVPFFTVLADPTSIDHSRLLHWAYGSLGFATHAAFIAALGLGFIVIILVSNLVNLLGFLAMSRFAFEIGDAFHIALFEEYLHRDFRFHLQANSATLASNVLHESARLTAGILQSGLNLITYGITIVFILISITAVNPQVALFAGSALGASYVVMYALACRRLLSNGRLESARYAHRTQVVNEGFAGIRELILSHAQGSFVRDFARCCRAISNATLNSLAIAQTPRYVLECIIACALVAVALWSSGQGNGAGAWVGQLSFLGFAAYRLMPALQQVFIAVARIRTEDAALEKVGADLQIALRPRLPRPAPSSSPVLLQAHARVAGCEIQLKHVSFRYTAGSAPAIDDLTLHIEPGSIVGLVGHNGSGKTTLVDLMTGLLTAEAGQIEVDGIPLTATNRDAWQDNIACVPQQVFVREASVAQNVALGVSDEEIDHVRVCGAVQLAQLEECIAALPNGYSELLGERGSRLSGGQRQRLALARALYRDASVFILDEGTSALDPMAEERITDMLADLSPRPTIVLIAHRVSALRRCDIVHELVGGKIARSGSYSDFTRPAPVRRAIS